MTLDPMYVLADYNVLFQRSVSVLASYYNCLIPYFWPFFLLCSGLLMKAPMVLIPRCKRQLQLQYQHTILDRVSQLLWPVILLLATFIAVRIFIMLLLSL